MGSIKFLFESDDLSGASPATVSRCGCVYFETALLKHIQKNWMQTFPENLRQRSTLLVRLEILIDRFLPTLVDFLRKRLPIYTESFLMVSLFKLIDIVLSDYVESDVHHPTL